MNQKTGALADRLGQAGQELIATIEGSSDEKWRSVCPGEGWTVGVTAHHITTAFAHQPGWLAAFLANEPLVRPEGGPHATNAQHAIDFANCTREETVAIARRDLPVMVATVRALKDEDLSRSADFLRGSEPWTIEQFIERVFIGHIKTHLASIESSVAAPA